MENDISKLNKQLLRRKIVSSVLLILLMASVLAFVTYAWMANNRDVSVSGVVLSTESRDVEVKYQLYSNTREEAVAKPVPSPSFSDSEVLDGVNTLNLYGFLKKPGDSVVIKLTITNNGASAVKVDSLGFLAPLDNQEVENAKEAKLGTQLYAAQVESVNSDTDATVKGKAGYMVLYDDTKALNQQKNVDVLKSSLIIDAKGKEEVFIRVVFNEANVPQNDYKSFGKIITDNNGNVITDSDGKPKTDGYCARNLYVECQNIETTP